MPHPRIPDEDLLTDLRRVFCRDCGYREIKTPTLGVYEALVRTTVAIRDFGEGAIDLVGHAPDAPGGVI